MSLNLELKFPGVKHKRILDAIRSRKTFSKRKMAGFYNKWEDADKQFRAHLPEREIDRVRKETRKLTGVPDYTTIEIPYSYAVLMTAHTYWSSVFLARTPILQFSARHGEPQMQVQAVEALVDYQVRVGEMIAPLYTWLYEMPKYGVAILGSYWEEQFHMVSEIIEEPVTVARISIGKTRKVKRTKRIRGYTGNRLYNVRPYDYFPDPRVPLSKPNDGEFVGRDVQTGWNTILKGEVDNIYFNVEQLSKMAATRMARFEFDPTTVQDWPERTNNYISDSTREGKENKNQSHVVLFEFYWELVPNDWGLGTSKVPEKWFFTVANDEIIIAARPMGMLHNRYPFYVQEFGLGTDEFVKWSLLEIMKPMNDVITWLFNSHSYNVRSALNDVRVVDPSRVVMADLQDPLPGGLIRIKPEFYGEDVRTMIHQLDVRDVTQTHLRDMQVMEVIIQRVTGVVDQLMGIPNPTGRRTATETRTTAGFSTNRLKTVSEYNSALSWGPMAQTLLQTTQELYDDERVFLIAGNLAETLFTDPITPDSIAGFYDFVPVDGNLPIDRLAQANFWKELIVQIGRSPELMQKFDVTKMLTHAMSLVGEKNVDQFKIQLRPDGALAADAQAGNVIALGGPSGGPGTTVGGPAPGSTGVA
ncbi:MAG: hypothetical protein FVQ79_00225 [Planctomycetes bacterium]|nr:hypothetical protein [Planctomycetota bacterium]